MGKYSDDPLLRYIKVVFFSYKNDSFHLKQQKLSDHNHQGPKHLVKLKHSPYNFRHVAFEAVLSVVNFFTHSFTSSVLNFPAVLSKNSCS